MLFNIIEGFISPQISIKSSLILTRSNPNLSPYFKTNPKSNPNSKPKKMYENVQMNITFFNLKFFSEIVSTSLP